MGQETNKVSVYKMPELEEMNRRIAALGQLWADFLESEGHETDQYHVHKPNLFQVVKRQDQRMHYYKVFHALDYPCEYKYIAIECFWINTLKPFIVLDEKSSLYECPNEMFSLYLILATIRSIFELYFPEKKFEYPSKERMRDILYDFKYCSLSREAMISFVETFADNYGVGIQFILDHPEDIKNRLKDVTISKLFGLSAT